MAIGQERLERECSATCTAFKLPASPLCKKFRWQLCVAGSSQLTGTTEVERVWWALGKEGQIPADGDWTSKPAAVPHDGFRASSDTVIWIRLPQAAWVNDFRAGFCPATARLYRTPATRREIVIPLREFESAEELRNVGISSLNVWLNHQGAETFAELVRVEVVDRSVRREQRISATDETRSLAGTIHLV